MKINIVFVFALGIIQTNFSVADYQLNSIRGNVPGPMYPLTATPTLHTEINAEEHCGIAHSAGSLVILW